MAEQQTEQTVSLDALVKLQQQYQEAIQKDGRQAILATLSGIFERFPEVEAIRWRQYTPYFNDGEPCEFSVHDAEVSLRATEAEQAAMDEEDADADEDLDDEDYEEGDFIDSWSLKDEQKSLAEALSAFDDAADECEDAFQIVFGDHCQVTATRDGIEVEDYEHD